MPQPNQCSTRNHIFFYTCYLYGFLPHISLPFHLHALNDMQICYYGCPGNISDSKVYGHPPYIPLPPSRNTRTASSGASGTLNPVPFYSVSFSGMISSLRSVRISDTILVIGTVFTNHCNILLLLAVTARLFLKDTIFRGQVLIKIAPFFQKQLS